MIKLTDFDRRQLKIIDDETNRKLRYYYTIKSLKLDFITFTKYDFDFYTEYKLKIANYIKQKYGTMPNGVIHIEGNSVTYSETLDKMYREIFV